MKIFLHELSTHDTELEFTQDEPWVVAAIEKVDEQLEESKSLRTKKVSRKAAVRFNLRKVDEVAVVDGRIETDVRLVCSRCASEFAKVCDLDFSSLFCQDPDMAGVAHLGTEAGKPMGQNRGVARTGQLAYEARDTSAKDLDITYLSQDFIDLADVLTEQLRLQVPFQPLCKVECKGMCSNCGADLNVGRCACPKVAQNTPFSVLRNLKT